MNRRSIFAALAAAAVAVPAVVAPALITPAAAQIGIRISLAPPAPLYEPVPVPRPGYVWAPGSWIWNNSRFAWRGGYWIPARTGYRYVPERWEPHWEGGRQQWRHVASRWDRDGDGIANRYDQDRDGDRIPNRYDRHPGSPTVADRDRDGVPNFYDRKDDNPHRW